MPDNLEDQKVQDYIDAIINAKLNTEIPKLFEKNIILESRVTELENKVEELTAALGGSGDTSCCDAIEDLSESIDSRINDLSSTVSSLVDRVTSLEGGGGGELN